MIDIATTFDDLQQRDGMAGNEGIMAAAKRREGVLGLGHVQYTLVVVADVHCKNNAWALIDAGKRLKLGPRPQS